MAKQVGKIAKRYARALLRAVEQEMGIDGEVSPAQDVARQLRAFAEIWENDPQLSLFISNPMFNSEERENALVSVAGAGGLPEIAKRFLRVLFKRDRLMALPEIVSVFSEEADEAAGVVRVQVTTARSVDGGEQAEIENLIRSKVDGTPNFRWDIDGSLIGGIRVRFGGKVVDGSLFGRLERLERQLLG